MRHLVQSVICSTFCHVKLYEHCPTVHFFVSCFSENKQRLFLLRALIDLHNRDKEYSVWEGKLLFEFNLSEFHYSENSLLYLLFSSAAYLCSIISCDYSNTVFFFMFLPSQISRKNWKSLRLFFHTVQRLNKVLYFPLFFLNSGAAKTKGESFTYKVRKLLQQILLCIPDFSIKK
jgi:hypothetical protein